jgi:hypothetical protein
MVKRNNSTGHGKKLTWDRAKTKFIVDTVCIGARGGAVG